jgi:hypothetical protein
MVSSDDEENRSPALVFCFNRDECWAFAERLKGLQLVSAARKKQIDEALGDYDDALTEGVGPKLRQMLLRGVGVHHAGVLPKHKRAVEDLFERKLIPMVVCTETLAAGINLPARSVVLSTLIKGPFGEKKIIPASSAHQMFGRAGRPQFDTRGYVYAVAHDDDVKINKWRKRYDQIDPKSKDPGILRMKKELERKRPTRRKTEQYWSEGQFRTLVAAGPAKLSSRSMIPYQVLVFLLTGGGTLDRIRRFLEKRFAPPKAVEKFTKQLEYMLDNLAALGYVTRDEEGVHVTLDERIKRLSTFRSVDPLYGDFLSGMLVRSDFDEKLLALESVLELPRPILRKARIPFDRPMGPLEEQELRPLMIQMGIKLDGPDQDDEEEERGYWHDPTEDERPPTFPEMLKIAFDAKLASPEPFPVQPKWAAGAAFERDCEFFKFVKSADLVKQEGVILRHLLRLVILAGEFQALTDDPDYERIAALATRTCHRVEPEYTERFLSEAQAMREASETVV